MDRRGVAARTAKPIGDLPAHFMLDPATYEHGASLGFPGYDFYVSGRGGVLGNVDADVVSAGFVFFNPTESTSPGLASSPDVSSRRRIRREHRSSPGGERSPNRMSPWPAHCTR